MRSAGIADLKNNLSRYLREVREGREILVRDRHLPVAKIVPLPAASDPEAEELALTAAGRLRLPSRKLPESFWTPSRKGRRVRLRRLVEAVVRDREERDAGLLGR